jgi:hypothetical protein
MKVEIGNGSAHDSISVVRTSEQGERRAGTTYPQMSVLRYAAAAIPFTINIGGYGSRP